MKLLLDLYPGDQVMLLVAAVFAQVTAVLLVAWPVSLFLRRASAPARRGLWLAALMCVLVGPLLVWGSYHFGFSRRTVLVAHQEPTIEPSLPTIAEATVSTEDEPTDPVRPAVSVGFTETASSVLRGLTVVAVVVWAGGVLFLTVRLVYGLTLVLRLRRSVSPLDRDDTGGLLAEVRQALCVRRLPSIMTSNRTNTPISVGLFRPLVILPIGLSHELKREDLRDVLVHECAHIVNRDHLLGLLQRIARLLFWPHPLIHKMSRELIRCQEEICDNYVIGQSDRCRYVRTLVDLAETCRPNRRMCAAMTLIHHRWTVEERVRGILDERRSLMTHMNRWTFIAVLATFLTVGLVIGTVRLEAADKKVEKTDARTAEDRKVIEVLQKTIVSFEFEDSSVAETVEYLRLVGKVNIILDADKMPDPAQKISLKLINASLETALKLLTRQIGMKYVVRDGVVLITSDAEGVRAPDKKVEKAGVMTEEDRKVIETLQKTTASFAFQDSPVAETLEYLGMVGNINIILDKAKMPDPAQKINLKVINVSLEKALKLLTRQLGMKYVVRDGVVLVTSDAEGVRAPDKKKGRGPKSLTEPRVLLRIDKTKKR